MSESEIKNDNDNKNIINDSNEKKIENKYEKNFKNDIEDNNSINFENENEIKVKKLEDIKNIADNKNDKSFIQQQKEFKELLLNQKVNKNLSMDQENLFETFVLFQNFMNMNKNKKDSFSINKFNFADSKIDDTINENNNIKEDNNINESNINENNINKSNLNDTKIKENESEKDNLSIIYNKNIKKNLKNYDDIPIKSSNSNFLELLEKTLANEKNELNKYNSTPKKKIIKVNSEVKKRQIQLSKPSKKDKKYSYYTDFLDEKGHFIEEKFSKNTHPKSGRNKSSNSNKKHSFSENKNNLSDNISNIDIKINNKTSRPLHDIIFDNKLNYDENSDKKNDNNNNIEVIVEKNEKKKFLQKKK